VVFHGSVANVHPVIVWGELRKYAHRSLTAPPPLVERSAECGRRIMGAAGVLPGIS